MAYVSLHLIHWNRALCIPCTPFSLFAKKESIKHKLILCLYYKLISLQDKALQMSLAVNARALVLEFSSKFFLIIFLFFSYLTQFGLVLLSITCYKLYFFNSVLTSYWSSYFSYPFGLCLIIYRLFISFFAFLTRCSTSLLSFYSFSASIFIY